MSLDLYVYSKSPKKLTTNDLSKALMSRQIGAAIFDDYIDYNPAASGPISTCTLLGWMPATFDSTQLTAILNAGEKERLRQLFADESIGYANIYSTAAAEHYAMFEDNYPDSLAGQIEPRFLAFMKSAKIVYEIQTSAGRSDFSWRFQMAVCSVIAETTDGLIEEPQLGEYFFPDEADDFFRPE